jgi:hypothetical protein
MAVEPSVCSLPNIRQTSIWSLTFDCKRETTRALLIAGALTLPKSFFKLLIPGKKPPEEKRQES